MQPGHSLVCMCERQGRVGEASVLPQEPPLDSNIEDKRGGSVSSGVCVCVCVCVFSVFSSPLLAILKSHFVNVF